MRSFSILFPQQDIENRNFYIFSVIVIHSIAMTKRVVFTKRAARSGKGYLVWIPKDVVSALNLDKDTYIQGSIVCLGKPKKLSFVKRISRSGRGYLLWLPKDISDFLKLKKDNLCEFEIEKLGDKR